MENFVKSKLVAAVFSDNGYLAAPDAKDGSIQVWDAESGALLAVHHCRDKLLSFAFHQVESCTVLMLRPQIEKASGVACRQFTDRAMIVCTNMADKDVAVIEMPSETLEASVNVLRATLADQLGLYEAELHLLSEDSRQLTS